MPTESSSVFEIYRLIPLPIVINGQQYEYSSLPKIRGINTFDKTIIKWDDEKFASDCIFSSVILCREHPVRMPVSSVPCIASLLGISQDVNNTCEVVRL